MNILYEKFFASAYEFITFSPRDPKFFPLEVDLGSLNILLLGWEL